jgi:hypothetical protein
MKKFSEKSFSYPVRLRFQAKRVRNLQFESASHRKTTLGDGRGLITIAQAYKYVVYRDIAIAGKGRNNGGYSPYLHRFSSLSRSRKEENDQ